MASATAAGDVQTVEHIRGAGASAAALDEGARAGAAFERGVQLAAALTACQYAAWRVFICLVGRAGGQTWGEAAPVRRGLRASCGSCSRGRHYPARETAMCPLERRPCRISCLLFWRSASLPLARRIYQFRDSLLLKCQLPRQVSERSEHERQVLGVWRRQVPSPC